MFALVDVNNMYVSCERVFKPSLIGRPVVVLSNNDGACIVRSNEAKDLGVRMAQPAAAACSGGTAPAECRILLRRNDLEVGMCPFSPIGRPQRRLPAGLESSAGGRNRCLA